MTETTGSYIGTFQRVEKKYVLNPAQYAVALAAIEDHLQPDAFPRSYVTSLYYDTVDSQVIRRSLEKPLYKEKLRLRVYRSLEEGTAGTPLPDDAQVFVELKKKYKGVVYKRRLGASAAAVQAFLQGMPYEVASQVFPCAREKAQAQACSWKANQVAREIVAYQQRFPLLRPAWFTLCDRQAWHDPESQLRVTFDARIQAARWDGTQPFMVPPGQRLELRPPGYVLMEIKQAGGMPRWLTSLLSANKIYPQSFSKYGTAYEKELKNA